MRIYCIYRPSCMWTQLSGEYIINFISLLIISILNTFLGFSLARLKRVSSKLCRPANFHRHTQLPFTPIPCVLLLGPLSTLCIVQGSACALCRAAHCGARCKVFIRSPKQERSQPTVAALKWGGLRSPVTDDVDEDFWMIWSSRWRCCWSNVGRALPQEVQNNHCWLWRTCWCGLWWWWWWWLLGRGWRR